MSRLVKANRKKPDSLTFDNPRLARTEVSESDESQVEFYESFHNCDDCPLTEFDEALERVRRLIIEAAGSERAWRKRVGAVVLAVLVLLDEEPVWARLLIDESPIASAAIAERRQAALAELAGALANKAQAHANSTGWFLPSSELTAELVVGGIFSGLRAHLIKGADEPFVQLAPSLIGFINQASGPISETLASDVETAEPGGKRLPLRTTYRTSRVLCAIGESPGLNNREIAQAAGLIDEGQTSKLLRRLERRGLIENFGMGQTYGGPNAWSLTAYGERARDATRHSLVPGAGAIMGRRVRGEG